MATTRLATVQEKMKEILKCVACHAVPHDKVFQCAKGHLTCERCSAVASSCPNCPDTDRLPDCDCDCPNCPNTDKSHSPTSTTITTSSTDWIRNRAMEEAIAALKFPKRCRSERCQFRGLGRDLMLHEKRCRIKKWTRRIDLLVPWYE